MIYVIILYIILFVMTVASSIIYELVFYYLVWSMAEPAICNSKNK
jgi:hypothetical protein